MPDQWYYEHEMHRCGPVSSRQLRAFAAAGVIRPTDTIWKEGVERGVVAAKVKNLFVAAAPLAADGPTGLVPLTSEHAQDRPTGVTAAAGPVPATKPAVFPLTARTAAKKLRAVAVRGMVIIAQDGTHVQFMNKCSACGREDAARVRVPIELGINGVNFYCNKCRKSRQAEYRGEH